MQELGSDILIDNDIGNETHNALGVYGCRCGLTNLCATFE